jgi:hypothetical protein
MYELRATKPPVKAARLNETVHALYRNRSIIKFDSGLLDMQILIL